MAEGPRGVAVGGDMIGWGCACVFGMKAAAFHDIDSVLLKWRAGKVRLGSNGEGKMKKSKISVILAIVSMMVAPSSLRAQSMTDGMMELDPNIIAAAQCNGSLLAGAISNFQSGVLNEQRARVMARTTTLAFWLTATKYQSVQHLIKYGAKYDEFFNASYDSTYDAIYDGTFTWESQAEMDICTARVFDPLTSVSQEDLERSGIDDYFAFTKKINDSADKRFDYILRLLEAMQ